VDAGTYHAFHSSWLIHLSETINGLLPSDYYALPEQHMGRKIADVLTLHSSDEPESPANSTGEDTGGIAVLDAPPKVSRTVVIAPATQASRRTLAIRSAAGHRLVAIIEIVSPGNKSGTTPVREFIDKVREAIRARIHVVVIDLFPPGNFDAHGLAGTIVEQYGVAYTSEWPEDKPLNQASLCVGVEVVAYIEHLKIGDRLPEMPLFFRPDRYINLPLEMSYGQAFRGMPALFRKVLED
jgi:hypothetical protein